VDSCKNVLEASLKGHGGRRQIYLQPLFSLILPHFVSALRKCPFQFLFQWKPAFISKLPHSFFRVMSLTGKGEAETFSVEESRASCIWFRTFLHLLHPSKAFLLGSSHSIELSGGAVPLTPISQTSGTVGQKSAFDSPYLKLSDQ